MRGIFFGAFAVALVCARSARAVPAEGDSYMGRWSFSGSAGAGAQPDTGIPLFATSWRFGLRPFLGALIFTPIAASLETLGSRFTSGSGAVGIALDIGYLFVSHAYTRRPHDAPWITAHAGYEIGIVWGGSSRDVPLPDNTTARYAFDQIKPDASPNVEIRKPLVCKPNTRSECRWLLVVRGAVHTPALDLTISRWSITAGLSYEWGFGDGGT